MKQIYNEGRVVGLSAWELYVRQLLSLNPEAIPLSEREWLSATISENSSMILRIPKGTKRGYHDFMLPEGTDLCGCTVVYGSLFEGEVELDESENWAIKVKDYGRLISNTRDRHPLSPGSQRLVPADADPISMTSEFKSRCLNYLNLSGGLVLQPGQWVETGEGKEPYATLVPDLSKRGFVRIGVRTKLTADVYILLHGFMFKTLASGEVGFIVDGESHVPQDGDFLGPSTFPWACPIVLLSNTNTEQILKDRIEYLGTLHTISYTTELLDESEQIIETEDGEDLLFDAEGTVTKLLWQDDVPLNIVYYVPLEDEVGRTILDELGNDLLAPKYGTIEEMLAEGGEL